MGPDRKTAPSLPEVRRGVVPEPHARPLRGRLIGLLLVLVGMSLVILSGGGAVARVSLDRGGAGVLLGGPAGESLAGLDGGDVIRGGAGADLLVGGDGDDELSGGSARDTLLGGAGNDLVEARGGGRDYVDCGSGEDLAAVDAADRVSQTCEAVRRD